MPPGLNARRRRRAADARHGLGGEAGDTLIEVIISALLVALIVVATFNGLDGSNKASALARARSEADVLAQQEQARLRTEPVAKLSELESHPRVEVVTQNKTKFTITTTATYRPDATATTSCTSTAAAEYIETSSKVTWAGESNAKAVVESGIISPPPDTTLLVQVADGTEPVAGMTVAANGPATAPVEHTLETSAGGCAIFALSPGEYTVNVSRAGYVTPDGDPNSKEDPQYEHSSTKYLVAETTGTLQVQFAPAGEIEAKFTGAPAEGDSFEASNAAMFSSAREFPSPPTVGTFKKEIFTGKNVFPFPASEEYSVYAGTCSSDSPEAVGSVIAPKVVVTPGPPATKVTLTQPPVNLKVMSGTKAGTPAEEGSAVSGAAVKVEDTKCKTIRTQKTNAEGKLERPNLPFGTYKICVFGGALALAKERKFTTEEFNNDTVAGPSKLSTITNGGEHSGYGVIYMKSGAATSPGKLEGPTNKEC
ncbi:MAG TPA: carboxypeptidase-like regulatory domain-containing protein [Solirubrobacteraceae bacterium]|nr:carboxypeptidase-like regulatory domain-containing protein [Solirubrobacteraceae bacterium]